MITLYVLLAAGGVIALSAWFLYRHGQKTQVQKQTVLNLEEYIDARDRADKAVDTIRAVDELDDIDRKLRKRGALRDG